MKFYMILHEMEGDGDLEREMRFLLAAGFSWKENCVELQTNYWTDCQSDYDYLPHESVGMIVDFDKEVVDSLINNLQLNATIISMEDYEDMVSKWDEVYEEWVEEDSHDYI